ncbi:MAG: hydroxymethylbilane synthase [Niabella sp.]
MLGKTIRIGTRDSQLAVWQADLVKNLLLREGHAAELVLIKSEGDIDLKTPLYAMGVQGVFTRSLDIALLNNHIDVAVHSMKDVPVQLPQGIKKAAILKRASYKDIFVANNKCLTRDKVFNDETLHATLQDAAVTIATSSIRRRAQWLHRYPHHQIENLRGNVNTRLQKVAESCWAGAVFAAAGLERIGAKPVESFELDWMLPAPAQGAIMVVAREEDNNSLSACEKLNHLPTDMAAQIERDFLSGLMGGCATPISALAEVRDNSISFAGSVVAVDGSQKIEVGGSFPIAEWPQIGTLMAAEIISKGGKALIQKMQNA